MNAAITRTGLPLACIALLTACNAVRQREVLGLFFDGVPAREPVARLRAEPVAPVDTDAGPRVPALYLAARAAPPGYRHKPYAERECLACHESQFSQKMRGTVTEVCQQCHQSVFAPRRFAHAPAADGGCLECHRPHESLQPALLDLPGNGVCYECHEEERVRGKPAHATMGSESCHRCHDPHGGGNKFFLKASWPGRDEPRREAAVAP